MADGGEVAETRGESRIAARERGFRLLAVTVTALFLAFAALGDGQRPVNVFWALASLYLLARANRVTSRLACPT